MAARGPHLSVRALRGLPPPKVLTQAGQLAASLAAKERCGTLLALHVHVARAAVALFDAGYAPESMYLPEAWLAAGKALQAAGDAAAAQAAWARGQHWVRTQALPQLPAPFIDSLLHRNPVNRELLALIPAA